MIWIVDGNRAETDKLYFELGLKELDKDRNTFEIRWKGPSKLLHNWADSSARVFFDFGGPALWRLLEFDRKSNIGSVKLALKISLQNFINEKVTGQRSELDERQLTLLALKKRNNRSKGLPGFELVKFVKNNEFSGSGGIDFLDLGSPDRVDPVKLKAHIVVAVNNLGILFQVS